MIKKIILISIAILLSCAAFPQQDSVFESAGPVPETYPLCTSPQDIAPMQVAGGNHVYVKNQIVWNGKDYAVLWTDYSASTGGYLRFRRFFADGTPASAAVNLPLNQVYYTIYPPAMVWNGSGYGVAYSGWSGSGWLIYFITLDENGALTSSLSNVSFYGMTQTADCYAPALAWSGNGYCVAWQDVRNGTNDIFTTLLNANGTVANAGASHDLVVSNAAYSQEFPAVAWSRGANLYMIVWQDYRLNTVPEIYGSTVTTAGVVGSNSGIVTGHNSKNTSLVDTGNGLGLVWEDYRDSNWEIYFKLLTATGTSASTDLRLTNDVNISERASIVWTGAEFGVFWDDNRQGNGIYNIWFQRVSASGTLPSGSLDNSQVTFTGGTQYPQAAFARCGSLVTGDVVPSGNSNLVQTWGCYNAVSVPGCPSNLIAYGVSGTSATIAWQASIDNKNDIAYYSVFRNDAEIAKTSSTYYTDTTLSTGTTYNYTVRAVNAAQNMNDQDSCGAGQSQSVYVKTNASFTLYIDKNDPNAHLRWDDIGLNRYNVFRGTSPLVMSQVGSTTSGLAYDDGVLGDNINYFYTVDDPGQ
jgi:hypothetical protein